jgi:hypothetical protein
MGKLAHGKSCTPTWNSWKGMHDRCKYRPGYSHVTVCERWQSFVHFYEDMGERPSNMTLDRIDGLKGYEPENCRWADIITQLENRDCTHWIEAKGERKSMGAWARDLGCRRQTIMQRLVRGWDPELAVTLRPRRYRPQPVS